MNSVEALKETALTTTSGLAVSFLHPPTDTSRKGRCILCAGCSIPVPIAWYFSGYWLCNREVRAYCLLLKAVICHLADPRSVPAVVGGVWSRKKLTKENYETNSETHIFAWKMTVKIARMCVHVWVCVNATNMLTKLNDCIVLASQIWHCYCSFPQESSGRWSKN